MITIVAQVAQVATTFYSCCGCRGLNVAVSREADHGALGLKMRATDDDDDGDP